MKRFDKQFKEGAGALSKEIGARRAAEPLELSYRILSGWRRRKQSRGDDAFIGSGKSYGTAQGMTDRERKMRRENDELRRANEILKDALGFFSTRL